MNAPKRIEILARGLWRAGSHVLVCRSIEHGHCYLPGGHVEPGESATGALVREFLEEAGVDVVVGDLCIVAEQRFVQGGKPRHELNLVFHVELKDHDAAGVPPIPPGNHPVVTSREPEIAFDWLAMDALDSGGFLPQHLIGPIVAWLGTPAAAVPHRDTTRPTAQFVPD